MDEQNCVKMVRHDNEFVQRNIWTHIRSSSPFLTDNLTNRTQHDLFTNHLSEDRLAIL